MGILGRLTGWDQVMAATNAVMANYLIEHSSDSNKGLITDEVVRIMSTPFNVKPTKKNLLNELNEQSRVAQMNFVALACDNLGIAPPFKSAHWTRVRNPYLISGYVKSRHIDVAIHGFKKNGYLEIVWSDTPYDFKEAYSSSGTVKNSDLKNLAYSASEIQNSSGDVIDEQAEKVVNQYTKLCCQGCKKVQPIKQYLASPVGVDWAKCRNCGMSTQKYY